MESSDFKLLRCEWNPFGDREATNADLHPLVKTAVYRIFISKDDEALHICGDCATLARFKDPYFKERINPGRRGDNYIQCQNGHFMDEYNTGLRANYEIFCMECHRERLRRQKLRKERYAQQS